MAQREQYFARVSPLLGRGLRDAVVGVSQVHLTGRVVELLAACQLQRVVLRGVRDDKATDELARYLRWKNPFTPIQWLRAGSADVEIGAGLLAPGEHPYVHWDPSQRRVTLHLCRHDPFSHRNLSYNVARQVRDILLGREPWPGRRTVHHGCDEWPFSQTPKPAGAPPRFRRGVLSGKHLLVVGCGSVGSEALRLLEETPNRTRWTLIDGGTVSIFNPVRQWFGVDEVGEPKVELLRRRLGPRTKGVPHNATPDRLARLLERDPPDAALLTTGTADQAWMAPMLQERGVPHVVASAYPQARFYEVNLVHPTEATPCLHCFRGHLYRGRESAPAIDDELASFLYRELDPDTRERAYEDLVAEPASAIETGRIAEVAAQCLVELLVPAPRRTSWLSRVIETGTTCLLGGNVVEPGATGPAYGLSYPGQVVRLGLDDVVGDVDQLECEVCGRRLQVVHRVELPRAPVADVDRALLASDPR